MDDRGWKPATIIKIEDPPRPWTPGDEAEAEEPVEQRLADLAAEIEPEEGRTIVGPQGEAFPVTPFLRMGVEKFKQPNKHYRLIWLHGRDAWLCNEKQTRFVTKGGAVLAGQTLAKQFGVEFSERTR